MSEGIITRRGGATLVPLEATGGTVSDIVVGDTTYRVHSFTSTGTSNFTVTNLGSSGGQVEYLIVGGGGNGSDRSTANDNHSGAGAGGMLEGTATVAVNTYSVVVGGATQNSTFNSATAIAGGNATAGVGNSGGSGSGGGWVSPYTGGAGTPGQGHDGGDGFFSSSTCAGRLGGGGGGAGGPGQDASLGQKGVGGLGLASSITGTSVVYCEGGDGGDGNGGVITAPLPNRGHGGSSISCSGGSGDPSGSSGIVVIRYPIGSLL